MRNVFRRLLPTILTALILPAVLLGQRNESNLETLLYRRAIN